MMTFIITQAWRNNVKIVFGNLSSVLTYLHIVSGVVCVVCPFTGEEKLAALSQNLEVQNTLVPVAISVRMIRSDLL